MDRRIRMLRFWGMAVIPALLAGCAGTMDDAPETDTESAAQIQDTERETAQEETQYQYGKAVSHHVFEAFDTYADIPEAADDDLPVITVLTMTQGLEDELENAVNAHIRAQGLSFRVEFVEPTAAQCAEIGGLYPNWMLYEYRKEQGLSADIFLSFVENEDEPWRSEHNLLDFAEALNKEGALYQALLQRLPSEALLDAYLGVLTEEDGAVYALPCNFDIASPYAISYSRELTDYYGIEIGDGLADLEKAAKKREALLGDGVAPICLDLMTTKDVLFLDMAGYAHYKEFWAVRQDGAGALTAVDFLEDEELLAWYEQLGKWRAQGALAYYSGSGMDCQEGYACDDILLLFGAEQEEYNLTYGCLNTDEDGNEYDMLSEILDIQTPVNFTAAGICVDGETEYPEECIQFLQLLYSDQELRRMLYYGVEGWSYYVDRTGETPVMVKHTDHGGLWDYGVDTSLDMMEGLELPWYDEKALEQQQARALSVLPCISEELDLGPVQEQFEACTALFRENGKVFRGYYGTETRSRLEELHRQLLDAGYAEVLEYMNKVLGEI